ncbi:MAG: radical SAM family heme chaperone HemW [Candidatus Krumholzibacteria bacterium]|nr:radical SAM family heme chaperone HemW [Candidatus Krumholzibacteria bacterium]
MKIDGSAGLYIHIPFCKTKCPYCDFYSITCHDSLTGYPDLLIGEMEMYRERFSSFDTIYLGGGTPSLIGGEVLTRILEKVRSSFHIPERTEITVEVNPDDVGPTLLDAWRRAGVNRISLGIQSFDDRHLEFLGRRHDGSSSVAAIGMVSDTGFENLGIDLIFGFHGQTMDDWRDALEKAAGLRPSHISCYQMTIEKGTPMGRMLKEGSITSPGEDIQHDMFVLASEFLISRGYLHYEVSNFALGEKNISRHNSRYWNHTPYLGLGPSAHSFDGRSRWWNHRDLDLYSSMILDGELPVEGREDLSEDQLRLERLYFGFRTLRGNDFGDIQSGKNGGELLEKLIAGALVTVENGRAIPTIRGMLFADRLPVMVVSGTLSLDQ